MPPLPVLLQLAQAAALDPDDEACLAALYDAIAESPREDGLACLRELALLARAADCRFELRFSPERRKRYAVRQRLPRPCHPDAERIASERLLGMVGEQLLTQLSARGRWFACRVRLSRRQQDAETVLIAEGEVNRL